MPSSNYSLSSLLQDKPVAEEILNHIEAGRALPRAERWGVKSHMLKAVMTGGTLAGPAAQSRPLTEAIVRLSGRPSLLVRNDSFETPALAEWRSRLLPSKSKLEHVLRSVGRIELSNHPDFLWVGTGWMIAENIIVTNRHVASVFAAKRNGGFAFLRNYNRQPYSARVDFKEEYRTGSVAEVPLDKIIYLEETGEHLPDLAFLQLAKRPHLPPPVPLWTERIDTGRGVVVIGYPARDSRNEPDAVTQVFGDIYDVKRLAPGLITGAPRKDWFFTHDCSTLGGNSGSLVADIETGRAVGLHFGGRFGEANFAVRANVLLDALARQQLSVPASKPAGPPPAKVPPEKKVTPTAYADRTGYDPEFLGTASGLIVPLPSPGAWASDLAPVTGAPTEAKHVLSYRHFSVALSKRRRLPIFTAVNIEGSQLRFLPRQGERWALDPRVSAKYQAGAELYANNDLDRGHMVRRLDPCWGTPEEAAQANEDTFHYANACPQHAEMNQGNWNDLENYLLDNAHAQALRVSVFTGPVLADDDRPYRGVRLPREYWKVAVWVDSASGKLAATGYMLSQADLVKNLEEFAYGPFRTYQVPIARIAQATKLDFGALGDHDPMATLPELAAQAAIPIVRSSDLRVR